MIMLTTSCNSEAAQPFPSAERFADPVARRLGSFLLFVITLLLPPVVYAQAQPEIKGAEPSRTSRIMDKEPKPFIRQESLADFSVNYELNAYCDDASQMMTLYTEMHRNIQDAFNENGVQIMTPAYGEDPAESKVVPKERWYTPPATLHRNVVDKTGSVEPQAERLSGKGT